MGINKLWDMTEGKTDDQLKTRRSLCDLEGCFLGM
jgi:hypothetical protein